MKRTGWAPPTPPSSSNKPAASAIEPRRFGLKYDPPSIVLEYASNGKLRHYAVHLKPHDLEKDAKRIAERLVQKHGKYFDPAKVDVSQLESLITNLKSRSGGSEQSSPSTSLNNPRRTTDEEAANPIKIATSFGDLNKASDEALQDAKDKMSVLFDVNRVDRDHPSYQWDRREEFKPEEPSDWDEEDDDF